VGEGPLFVGFGVGFFYQFKLKMQSREKSTQPFTIIKEKKLNSTDLIDLLSCQFTVETSLLS
jgi:hypothetical protein